MRKLFGGLIFLCLVALVVYCLKRDDEKVYVEEIKKIVITVNDRELLVELENNSSSDYFYKRLQKESITINTKDSNTTEKSGTVPFDLPRNEKFIDVKPGDLVLYQSNKIKLYYETSKTNLTKLGHVTNMDAYDLRDLLGKGDAVMKFSIKR